MPDEPCALPQAYARHSIDLSAEPLAGELTTDTVLIGGGITGCASALALAETGKSVAILESNDIGFGSSGRSYGLLVAYAKWGNQQLLRHFGATRGERLIAALASGPDQVFDLIERHQISCDAERNGWLLCAHKPSANAELESRADYWADRGAPVSFHGDKATAELTGSNRYGACLFDERSGGLNPLAYTRGLALAAQLAGAQVYQHSAVSHIARGKHARWKLSTTTGSIEADNVVHCTNAYTGRLWPGLAKTIIPLRAYALVTEELPTHLLEPILPGGQIITDTGHLFSGIRKLPDGRLHISTGGSVLRANGTPNKVEAVKRLQQTYPEIDPVNWSEQWSAWVGVSANQLPKIYSLDERMWAVSGYSGRGIAFATLLGSEVSKLIAEPVRNDLILPVEPLRAIPFHLLAPLAAAVLVQWYRLIDSL